MEREVSSPSTSDLRERAQTDPLGALSALVARTSVYPKAGQASTAGLAYATLGLAGEAGELGNKVKKILRGDYHGPFDPKVHEGLLDELADCLWYVTAAARECGATPQNLLRRLIIKLEARQANGTIQGEGDKR